MRSAAVRHGMAMGVPSLERTQQSSLHKRRVHVKQCFPIRTTPPKATLPQDGLQMIASCEQEDMDEMNSFETDPTSLDVDDHMTQPVNSEDIQHYSEMIVPSPLQRPRAPSPDDSSFTSIVNVDVHPTRFLPSPASPVDEDDDSSLDNEEEYTLMVNNEVLRPDIFDRIVVGGGGGGGRGDGASERREEQEDMYPFAWALDGRNVNENPAHNHPRPTTPLVCVRPSICVSSIPLHT